jgi:hypothetical protein
MPRTATPLAHAENEEATEYLYDSFLATLRIKLLDSRRIELHFSASPTGLGGEISATLVPRLAFGEFLEIEGVGDVTLGEATLPLREPPGWLAFKGIKMALPEGARIEYPVSPFSSYTADNNAPPSENLLAVKFPVGATGVVVRIEAGE